MDKESTVGLKAFSRMAPAIPIIADVITCFNLFDVLTTSTGGQLSFAIYDKYLGALDRLLFNIFHSPRCLQENMQYCLLSVL